MSFLEVLWLIIISFAFIAYLLALFTIISDLFRDKELSGVLKAVWFVALIVLPLLTALVYLVVRGNGMAERNASSMESMRAAQEGYIREVAGKASPADQIAQAKTLMDQGAISAEEFEGLKAKALA
ncbi:MAG: SHOCT domain-containing protein [Ornithinimicrobium sp.]